MPAFLSSSWAHVMYRGVRMHVTNYVPEKRRDMCMHETNVPEHRRKMCMHVKTLR